MIYLFLAFQAIVISYGLYIVGTILIVVGIAYFIYAKTKHKKTLLPYLLAGVGVMFCLLNFGFHYVLSHRFDSQFKQNLTQISFKTYTFDYLPKGYNVVRSGVHKPAKDPTNTYLFYRFKDDSGGYEIYEFDVTKAPTNSNCGPLSPELSSYGSNCILVATTPKGRTIYKYQRGDDVYFTTIGTTRVSIDLHLNASEISKIVDGLEETNPSELKFIQPF